jgi:dTMP kinase
VGLLIAFEGLDQSGKQTQAEMLRDRLVEAGRLVRLLSFPAYDTSIGAEIGKALQGDRDYGPDVMQLLYVANRYEWKPQMARELERGTVLICDRYLASSVAYGEAQGLDPAWLLDLQKFLPQPDLTFLLDIDPDVSARRKTADRDKYERDLALLGRVRNSYLRQASHRRASRDGGQAGGWVHLDANRDRAAVAIDVWKSVVPIL